MANSYDPGAAYLYLQTVPPSGNDLVSFYIDDFQLTYVPPPTIQTNIPSIYKTFADFFPIGAAVDTTDLSGTACAVADHAFRQHDPGERPEVEFGGDRPGHLQLHQRRRRGWRGGVRRHESAWTEPGVVDRRADSCLRLWRRNQFGRQPSSRHLQHPGAHPERGAAFWHQGVRVGRGERAT